MDVRIVRLYKLHIPKTIAFSEILKEKDKDYNYYYTVGHYDIIGIEKIDVQDNNVLLSSYNKMRKNTDNSSSVRMLQEICSAQSILVFNDKSMSQADIDSFWKKHEADLLFVSMLHIADEVEDIESVLKRIKDVYEGKKYLCYFTFDYSDIIIFCKGDCITNYLDTVNMLNYGCKEKKYIKDSFSILGICRTALQKSFEEFKHQYAKEAYNEDHENQELKLEQQCKYETDMDDVEMLNIKSADVFFSKFNLGVIDYKKLRAFVKELEEHELIKGITINQLGRHDFSIINEHSTLDWMLRIEYFIDKYTNVSEPPFSTFEVFVGSKYDDKYEDKTPDNARISTSNIASLSKKFYQEIGGKDFRFYLPISEVENSINSIVKNGFADDFVVCMYESFYRFIGYLLKRYELDKKSISEAFISVFNEYFGGLTSLANSAMHTERSFIQATAFNAIFYDIPPKFMAFYTAIVYKIIDIMRNNDEAKYAFVFTPNFSSEMIVKTISDKNVEPMDRLFVVAINEAFFYNPPMVISTMAHEIAHFAGDYQRSREVRTIKYLNCLILSILDSGLSNLDESVYDLVDNIREEIIRKIVNIRKILNSSDLIPLSRAVFKIIAGSKKIHKIIETGLFSNHQNRYDYIGFLNFLNNDLESVTYDSIEIIRSVFKEAHADLQMILLLDMDQNEYLYKMICQTEFETEELIKDEHILRFATICLVMYKRNWNFDEFISLMDISGDVCSDKNITENFKNKKEVLERIRNYITNFYNFIELAERSDDSHIIDNEVFTINEKLPIKNMYCMAQIYEYLYIDCNHSLEYYNEKTNDVKLLRGYYNDIKEFKNIIPIYEMIKQVIDEYKKTLGELKD